jgi:hypothetical protein
MMVFRRASTAPPTCEAATARWLEKMQTPGIAAPWVIAGAAAAGAVCAMALVEMARATTPEAAADRNLEVMIIGTLWRWRTGTFRSGRNLPWRGSC